MIRTKMGAALPGLLWLLAGVPTLAAQTVANDGTILKQIIIFGRHSVRSPVVAADTYSAWSPRCYPDFGVPKGFLTPHGQLAAVRLGAYFRQYLLAEGLLTGDAAGDLARSYFRANSIQRSFLTATRFGEGLIPGTTIPVHSYALGDPDPVFDPISTGVAAVDANRAASETLELYSSGAALASAYAGELSLIRSTLYDYPIGTQPPPATPSGVTDPTTQPIPLVAVTTGLAPGHVVDVGGIGLTELAIDPFIMEYAEGMPLADVAWGQLSPDMLSQVTRITTLEQRINYRSPYLDRTQSSNAAAHVLRSLKQAVLGEAIPGAFSSPTSQILVVTSSDTDVTGLAGLLQAHWQLPGYQPDFCAPGGALVFELRQSMDTGEFLVRVFYTAQSLDQLRNLTPLSLKTPPETIQLLIPGGSIPGASFDVKFRVFQGLLEKAIGWRDVQDPATETPPNVLSDVGSEPLLPVVRSR